MWQRTASSKKKMTREECQWRSGDVCIGDLIETSTGGSIVAQEVSGAAVKEIEEESWLHMYILAFACFGRFSDHPDPDINLSMSDGPPRDISESTLEHQRLVEEIPPRPKLRG